MISFDNKKTEKLMAAVLAVVLFAIMAFSAFFIAAHSDHECTGDDCPICACLQHCAKILHGFETGIAGITILLVPLSLILYNISLRPDSFAGNTPVSNKVRLNN